MNRIVTAIISKTDSSGVRSYFLVRSKKDFGSFTGYWYPPGGKVEAGETDIIGLRREIQEELGVRIDRETLVAETTGDVSGTTVAWYVCDIKEGVITVASSELASGQFFTREAMKELPLWPATKTFFEIYIFGKKNV